MRVAQLPFFKRLRAESVLKKDCLFCILGCPMAWLRDLSQQWHHSGLFLPSYLHPSASELPASFLQKPI